MPEHAIVCRPEVAPYVPGGQGTAIMEPIGQNELKFKNKDPPVQKSGYLLMSWYVIPSRANIGASRCLQAHC